MDTVQIQCTPQNVKSFLGVFPSDLLPKSISRSGSVIINADPHTERGSHWLAIHLEPRPSSAYYFDSYGLFLLVHSIRSFLRRNCTVWDYNVTRLQGLISTVCGHYCCLFDLYTDRGYTPKQFVALFNADIADRQVEEIFLSELDRYAQCRAAVNAVQTPI